MTIETMPIYRWYSPVACRLSSLIPSLMVVLLLTGCAWPMYRYGPNRAGRSGADTSKNGGTRQWGYTFGFAPLNLLPNGPVVGRTTSSGGIYVGDFVGNIYSISTTGKLAWQTPLTGGIGAVPNALGLDGSIYAPQPNGKLFTLNSTGVPTWTFAPPGGLSPANLAVSLEGTIYTGNQCGVFYALNPDGSVKWSFNTFARNCNLYSPTISAAIGADGTIYAGVRYAEENGGVLFALTPSGSQLWNSTQFVGTPTVGPTGDIYVVSLDKLHLYALNSSGHLLWQDDAPPGAELWFTLPAVAPSGTIYVGTAGAGLWAVNPVGGSTIWQVTPNGQKNFSAPPTIGGDGSIYIANASLYSVNSGGGFRWSTTLCGGGGNYAFYDEPVIGSDGTIYMLLDSGYVSMTQPPCPLEAFR